MWIGIEFGCRAHFESDVTFFIYACPKQVNHDQYLYLYLYLRFNWCSQSLGDMGNMYRGVFWADQRRGCGFKEMLVFEYLIVIDII